MKKRIFSMFLVLAVMISALVLPMSAYATVADYQIKQPISRGTGSGVVLTWKNPAVETISGIKVYDITNGKTEVTFTPVLTKNGRNEVAVTGLTANTTYKYLVEMSFTDRDTIFYQLYANSANGNKYIAPASWYIGNVISKNQISTIVEDNGNTAARITANQASYNDGNVQLNTNITKQLNKKHKVEFDYKGTLKGAYARLYWNATKQINEDVNEWTHCEWEVTPTSGSQDKFIFFISQSGCKDFLIDNLSVKIYDEATQTYGENLIKNGDFENSGDTCAAVTDVVATPGNKQLNVSWTNPSGSEFLHTRVYIKDGNELLFRGEVPASENSMTVRGLQNNKEYEIVVKAVDRRGRETAGVSVVETPFVVEANYQIQHPVSRGTGSGVVLTWKNPAVETISGIKVYDVTGEKTEVTFTPVLTKNGRNEVAVTGLAANTTYKYLVEMSFTDHDTIAYQLYANSANGNKYIAPASWNIGDMNVKAQISTIVEDNGNTAARITANQASYSDGIVSINTNITKQLNKKHKIEYDYKGTLSGMYARLYWNNAYQITSNVTEWTHYEKEVTPTAGSQDKFIFYITQSGCRDFLIDNVSVRIFDEATQTYGENIIKNGDFENNGAVCAEVTNVVTTEENGLTTVTWTNPTDATFLHTRIYLNDGENLLLRAELPSTETSYSIEASGYEVVVKAVDKYGREFVDIPDWEIDRFEILNSSNEVLENGAIISAGTSVEAKAVVVKNKANADISPILIFACYEGGQLSYIQTLDEESATEVDGVITYSLTYGSAEAGKTYKAFLWESFEDITPLMEATAVNCPASN